MLAAGAVDIGRQKTRPLSLQFPIRFLLDEQHLLGFGIALTPFRHRNSPSESNRSPGPYVLFRISGFEASYVFEIVTRGVPVCKEPPWWCMLCWNMGSMWTALS